VIYISKDQLNQVEYIIGQSLLGHHVLFDLDAIKKVFKNSQITFTQKEEDSYAVEHHIEHIIQQPSLAQKRAYLEKLDATTYEKVILTYFNIVENNLYEYEEARH